MIDYEFVKLNKICTKITDGSHYSPKGIEKGFPMLSVKDMLNNGFTYNDCKYISNEDYLDLVKSDCKPLVNDVLIAKDGSYLKHVFVVKEETDQAVLSSIGMLRPNLDKVIPEYLKYYLQTKSVKETVSKKYVSGSALPRIILKNFGEIDIIQKDLLTQRKIAKVLSDLDAKIELNNKINTELEAMAKLIYDYWFVQFDFPNENGKPYKSSGGKMVFNKELKREIPEGWVVQDLKEIAKCIMGQSPKGESYNKEQIGTPLLNGPADYENGALKGRTYTTSPTRLCQKDDMVLCIRATIGKLVYSEQEYCLGRGVAAVRPNEKRLSELVYNLLQQEIERFKIQATGSIIKGITKDDLIESKCLIPTDNLIDSFHKLIRPKFDKIRINKKENQKLAELRDWLLPMLMNGQVKVN